MAVGGTNSYFPDGQCGKSWNNGDPRAANTFWETRDQWYPTWNYPQSNDAAMKVDKIQVWQFTEDGEQLLE